MAETQDFRCPNCGSPLSLTGEENDVKCPYCGSTVVVPEELRSKKQDPQVFIQTNFPATQFPDQISRNTARAGRTAATIWLGITIAILAFTGSIVFFVLRSVNSVTQNSGTNPILTMVDSVVSTATDLPTSVPEATEVPTPIPQATLFSNILFKDDFSNTASGWDVSSDSNYTLQYVKNGYRIFINKQDGGQTVWNGDNFTDVNVQADIKQIAGPVDARAGVSCRVSSDGSFYSFEISPDGSYSIEKYTGGSTQSSSTDLAVGALNSGTIDLSQVNHLRGDCIGDVLTLYLNGQPLLQTTDDSFSSGATGLIATSGASGDAGIDMLFSNFVVLGP